MTAITEMDDPKRLALIKDVAGTNVYEEKKNESEKILTTSLVKMEEIKIVCALLRSFPLPFLFAPSARFLCPCSH